MINTRLTRKFNLEYPIIQAPMAFAAGGALAASVTAAGGLGLIGGAYGDIDWIEKQFDISGNHPVGCGLITWSLTEKPELLAKVLAQGPSCLFLSFGDPAPYAPAVKEAGVPLICQIQSIKDARHAIHCGADLIVAQGSEAGGHGEHRSTFTLVPEVANLIAGTAAEVLLCAAGGIADGRGLAAALNLGADGVLVGSRFWASKEAEVHPNMHAAAIEASGDDTIRSSVMDIARRLDWPERYTARVLKNDFTDQWHNQINQLLLQQDPEADRWRQAWNTGDTSIANTFVGEVAGLINSIDAAAAILRSMSEEAEAVLSSSYSHIS